MPDSTDKPGAVSAVDTPTQAVSPEPVAGRRPVVWWDVILTIVLLISGTILAILLGIAGISLGFAAPTDCFDCNNSQIFFGQILGLFGPPVLYFVFIVVAISRLVVRRRAFWAPIAGSIVAVLALLGGAALVFTAIPNFTFS